MNEHAISLLEPMIRPRPPATSQRSEPALTFDCDDTGCIRAAAAVRVAMQKTTRMLMKISQVWRWTMRLRPVRPDAGETPQGNVYAGFAREASGFYCRGWL